MSEMITLPREAIESMQKRLAAALDEPRETMSDGKALREIVRQLRLMRDELSTALAAGEARPVAVVTECEACFTPDVCQLRGTCDHYSAEWLRIAAPPQPAPVEVKLGAMLEAMKQYADFDAKTDCYTFSAARLPAALVAAMGVRNG